MDRFKIVEVVQLYESEKPDAYYELYMNDQPVLRPRPNGKTCDTNWYYDLKKLFNTINNLSQSYVIEYEYLEEE